MTYRQIALIAGKQARLSFNEGVADFRRRMQYQEKHDSVVKKFNRLMKPTQHQEAA